MTAPVACGPATKIGTTPDGVTIWRADNACCYLSHFSVDDDGAKTSRDPAHQSITSGKAGGL